MNADEYAKNTLKTWTIEWPVPQQVAHAAMTIVDEWWEVEALLDKPGPCDMGDLADELGDVLYGTVIMQTLVAFPYISTCSRAGRSEVVDDMREVHDLSTKYLRSQSLDYYDAHSIAETLQTKVLVLTDSVCGFIRANTLDPHEVAANNVRKLSKRYEEG